MLRNFWGLYHLALSPEYPSFLSLSFGILPILEDLAHSETLDQRICVKNTQNPWQSLSLGKKAQKPERAVPMQVPFGWAGVPGPSLALW